MREGKRGIPVCVQCARPTFNERYYLTHERLDGDSPETFKVFCSRCCLEEHFEYLFLPKVEAAVRKENNALAKLICPACKQRVRKSR